MPIDISVYVCSLFCRISAEKKNVAVSGYNSCVRSQNGCVNAVTTIRASGLRNGGSISFIPDWGERFFFPTPNGPHRPYEPYIFFRS